MLGCETIFAENLTIEQGTIFRRTQIQAPKEGRALIFFQLCAECSGKGAYRQLTWIKNVRILAHFGVRCPMLRDEFFPLLDNIETMAKFENVLRP